MKKICMILFCLLYMANLACTRASGSLTRALRHCEGQSRACFEAELGPPDDYGHKKSNPSIKYASWEGTGVVESGPFDDPWVTRESCLMDVYFENDKQVSFKFSGEGCMNWQRK